MCTQLQDIRRVLIVIFFHICLSGLLLASLDRQVFIEMGFKVNRESGIALYKKDLQELLVEHTRDFYRGKAKLWLAQDACPDYMRKAEVCVWFCLVWFGLVWFGLVWFGLVWFGLVWFDLVVRVLWMVF